VSGEYTIEYLDPEKKSGVDTYCIISGAPVAEWYPYQCVYSDDFELIVVEKIEPTIAKLRLARDYRSKANNVWGITARNREQNFALNFLLDPDIDLVFLEGTAGTGKTVLTLAAGFVQVMEMHRVYEELIMTRETVSIGQEIGYLPGTEEEKMAPWMGALIDNLELLGGKNEEEGVEGKHLTDSLLLRRVKIKSLNFMRGRTFLKRYLIIDEAQNLTSKQLKTLISRAGPGTKVICIGNLAQIDTPYLSANTSGLTYAIECFKGWPHSACIQLERGERSRLADAVNDLM
jgi:PhoH-like ATPase